MAETGYSRSPKLLKGALIQFSAPMLIPIPNIIIFQYNPETMTRQLSPWVPAQRQVTYDDQGNVKDDKLSGEQLNQLSQPFDPQETFSLVLELDAADSLEAPATHPVAVLAGVADRISAMEMLCYPPGPGALGGLLNVSVSVSIGAGGISASVGTADVSGVSGSVAVESKEVERVGVSDGHVGAGGGHERAMQVVRQRGPQIDRVARHRVTKDQPRCM